jgi:two-component system, OmpR family, copper resistance phosphate regulon response regulator CusR
LNHLSQNDCDILILDLVLPDANGLDLCKKIKEIKPELPILMLTSMGTTEDKVSGFEAGTDDYLTKPFEFKELVARIKALLKRSNIPAGKVNKLVVADLELDINKKSARRGSRNIDLTVKEYALLEFLMKNCDKVVSRSHIAEQVWDIGFDTGTNRIDVYINILRKKIDQDFEIKLIQTKIGMGYMLKSAD